MCGGAMANKDQQIDGAILSTKKAIYAFDKKHRIVVIGSEGHAGATCVSWGDTNVPNIVDFEICIVNVRSLTKELLETTKHEYFDGIARKLVRLLASSGTVVVLMNHFERVKTPKQYPESTSNYRWCPFE